MGDLGARSALPQEAESEEADTMRRPPRPPTAPLFTAGFVAWSMLQGALVLGLILFCGSPIIGASDSTIWLLVIGATLTGLRLWIQGIES